MHLNKCRQDTHTYKKGEKRCVYLCITVMKALDLGCVREDCLVFVFSFERGFYCVSLAGLKLKSSACLWREPKVCVAPLHPK